MNVASEKNCLVLSFNVKPFVKEAIADWQAKLHAVLSAYPGFLSLEMLAPSGPDNKWMFVQRFQKPDQVSRWRLSNEYKDLKTLLIPFLRNENVQDIEEQETGGI